MKKPTIFTLVFYFLVALFFLRGVVFSPGVILGGDWALPSTLVQMQRYFQSGFYTWTDRSLLGNQQSFLNSLPFQVLIGFLAKLGIAGEVYIKLLLVFVFVFPALTMFWLCQFLGCQKKVSVFGGLLYITLSFFFNYAAIGWFLVLFSMGVLPLSLIFFIKSVKEKKISFSILTGFLYSLAMVQSQSLVWYPLVYFSFAFFLIKTKKDFLVYLKSLLVVFLVFLGMNAFWHLPLFFSGSSGILDTKFGLSSVSLGTWARLSNLNILRAWGSLFNYQYESSYPKALIPLSFLLPFLAYLSLFFLRKKREVYSLVFLSFVSIVLFKLGPGFIARLPFSDLIRDVARFSVISSFSYVVLITMLLNFMFRDKRKQLKIIGVICCILLIINAYPFWMGGLFGELKHGYDVRLRAYKFPEENVFLEKTLMKEGEDIKSLYLPMGSVLRTADDKRFYGLYGGMSDIFAHYSPKRGGTGVSGREMGSAANLTFKLAERIDNQQFDNLSKLLSLMNVKYVVARKNIDCPYGVPGKKVISSLNKKVDIVLKKEWDKIFLFENNNFLPHFYIPQDIVYSSGEKSLFDIVGLGDYSLRSGVYLKNEKIETKNEKEKIKNKEVLKRANRLFIKAELENIIGMDYFKKKEEFKNSMPFPYVKHKPGSLGWKMAKLKEEYGEWKLRKKPEKLLDKKLFYAGKRISELNRWVTDNEAEDLILGAHQKKIVEAIELIRSMVVKDNQMVEIRDNMVIKIRAYWERHKEKVESVYSRGELKYNENVAERMEEWWGGFERLDGKIKPLEKKFDLRNLEYNFEIPEKGHYSLFIKSTGKLIELTDLVVEEDEETLSLNGFQTRDSEWANLGEREFKEGGHKLTLRLPELENLVVDDWQKVEKTRIKKQGVTFFPQGFFPATQNLVFQKINGWQSNNFYYLTFDYKSKGGSLGFGILEERVKFQRGEEIVKIEKMLEKSLVGTESENWSKFETIVKSDPDVLGAQVCFWSVSSPNQLAKVDFKNLRIYKIIQPEVALYINKERNKAKTEMPKITFIKINPTKYKIRVEGAKEPYTLVFSESFHRGWKLYLKEIPNNKLQITNSNLQKLRGWGMRMVGKTASKITGVFLKNKGYGEETASYFNGDIKERVHKMTFLEPATFETWTEKPIVEDRHYLINNYANSWYITPQDTSGKENYELIVEFWPQRLFYMGLFISGTTLISCLGYLGSNYVKKRIFL